MKKHLSVLMLFVRSAIFKVFGLFAVMSAVELLLFRRTLNSVDLSQLTYKYAGHTGQGLEYIIKDSYLIVVLGITYILLTVILLKNCNGAGKQVYTFQRLSISEHEVFAWQAVCNTGFYFLLWAVQAALVLVMSAIYMKTASEDITSGQTVFLAFYRSRFIHNLIPLEQIWRWIRNICVMLGLGVSSAYTSYVHRHDGRNYLILIMMAGMLFFFVEINNEICDALLILISLLQPVLVLSELRREGSYEAR